MKTWSLMISGFALAALLLGPLKAGEDAKRTWTFDDDETGVIAKGFTNEVGEWKVAASDNGKALAQSAKNPNSVFNISPPISMAGKIINPFGFFTPDSLGIRLCEPPGG